jgi:hypothetical protein
MLVFFNFCFTTKNVPERLLVGYSTSFTLLNTLACSCYPNTQKTSCRAIMSQHYNGQPDSLLSSLASPRLASSSCHVSRSLSFSFSRHSHTFLLQTARSVDNSTTVTHASFFSFSSFPSFFFLLYYYYFIHIPAIVLPTT